MNNEEMYVLDNALSHRGGRQRLGLAEGATPGGV